jgi:hypothetical protein
MCDTQTILSVYQDRLSFLATDCVRQLEEKRMTPQALLSLASRFMAAGFEKDSDALSFSHSRIQKDRGRARSSIRQ